MLRTTRNSSQVDRYQEIPRSKILDSGFVVFGRAALFNLSSVARSASADCLIKEIFVMINGLEWCTFP